MLDWFRKLFSKEVEDPMKYLVVGLGNMHPNYDNTRHNVGFEVIDKLAGDSIFKHEMHGDITEVKHKGRTLILLKPSTYMNLSGKAVRYWMQKKKIQPENLLIVVDDLNLDFGKIRMRNKGSDGGHNGLKDINEKLGNNKYNRLRFGIGNTFGKGKQVDYVLGKWGNEEKKNLDTYISTAAEAVKSFASIGLNHTMNQFNN